MLGFKIPAYTIRIEPYTPFRVKNMRSVCITKSSALRSLQRIAETLAEEDEEYKVEIDRRGACAAVYIDEIENWVYIVELVRTTINI